VSTDPSDLLRASRQVEILNCLESADEPLHAVPISDETGITDTYLA